MGGTSFLTWSGEVVCWCVRHLYTRGNPGVNMPLGGCSWLCWYGVDIAGWRRASSSSSGHGGYGAAVAGRGRLSPMSSLCPVIRTPCRKVSPSCHEIPISRARRLPPASNNSCRIRGCGPVSSCAYALVSSRSSRVWLTNRDKSPNATLDYGTAGANHRRQPECWYCPGPGPSIDLARS